MKKKSLLPQTKVKNPEPKKTPTTESVTQPKKPLLIGWNLKEPVEKQGQKVRAVRIFHTLNQED